ncbi:MAG: Flp pilus assembly protein TadB [Crocinitomix sp.]|jgi:Flp pilus assembly protein TadB
MDPYDPLIQNYLFALAHLIIFSRGANKYNRDMERITNLKKILKRPKADKQKVQESFKVVASRIKKRQKGIYIAFGILTIIHYAVVFSINLKGVYLSIPVIMLIGMILLILFFYSFKGGRVIPDIEFD